jgi:hypothetical protein
MDCWRYGSNSGNRKPTTAQQLVRENLRLMAILCCVRLCVHNSTEARVLLRNILPTMLCQFQIAASTGCQYGVVWGSASRRILTAKAIDRQVSRLESFEMCLSSHAVEINFELPVGSASTTITVGGGERLVLGDAPVGRCSGRKRRRPTPQLPIAGNCSFGSQVSTRICALRLNLERLSAEDLRKGECSACKLLWR